jgi:hypothetical protein
LDLGDGEKSNIQNYRTNFGLGAMFVILFLYYLLLLYVNERLVRKHYYECRPLPSDYALEVKNLPDGLTETEMIVLIAE